MNTPKGQIKRSFIFSDNVPWSSASAFDRDLADFFKTKGLSATMIPAPDGEILDRAIWLERVQEEVLSAIAPSNGKSNQKPKSMTQMLNAAKSKFTKGK